MLKTQQDLTDFDLYSIRGSGIKISSQHIRSIEIFLFSPNQTLGTIKIVTGEELKIYKNDLMVKSVCNEHINQNLTITWKFKHILIKFEGKKIPALTHALKNRLRVAFLSVKSRLGDELIIIFHKIIDFFSNLGKKHNLQ